MLFPDIPLFDWLIENLPKTKIDLANNSITGVPLSELLDMTGFVIPADFNLGKNDPFGADDLREILAQIYNCEKQNIVPTTGGSEANFLVFLSHLEPGDEVIMEQPGYPPLWLVPQMLGAQVIYWERKFEDRFALDFEALKNKITDRTKLIVITNLHNPSGILVEHDEIKALAEIAAENNVMLLIDEMFLDVADTEIPQRSAVGLDSVIVTASVSKVYGIGGLRTGWIIGSDEIAKKCLSAKWQASVAAPYISEVLVAAALSNARDKLINRCKSIAKQNFTIVNDWIKNNIDLIEWIPPSGGIMGFPQLKNVKTIDSVTFSQRLLDEMGVLVSPGKYFGSEGHFRLTFMNPPDVLHAGLAAIIKVLENLKKK
jgi:aspartate/methionine/tyrosine aminotransferase